MLGEESSEKPVTKAVREFLGDESGTSRVAEMFEEDAAAMRRMKEKRDAALAELERSKSTPHEMKVGQETMRAFLAERDVWSARVNQVISRLRKMVPDHVEQEALSLMRDFKGREAELAQYLDGSHPALHELEEGDRQIAERRIEQIAPAIRRALNPTERMRKADAVLTKIAQATLDEGKRLYMMGSRYTAEEYNPHILHPKGEGDYAQPRSAMRRAGKALGNRMGKYFAFAEHREFPTLMDAIIHNYKPKTLNAFDAFTIHGDKFATARATRLLEGQLGEAHLGMYTIREDAPEGWVRLASHSTEFRRIVPWVEQESGERHATEMQLFVPKYIEEALRLPRLTTLRPRI